MSAAASATAAVVTADAFLSHWLGHRRLTRRVIEAFPDDQLFTHSVGGMRPFGVLAMELVEMAGAMVRGVATDDWQKMSDHDKTTAIPKSEVLRLFDQSTAVMQEFWPKIPAERFTQTITAFGQWPGKAYDLLLYVVDNEIHHRGQGYVYLRSLGIAPPAFYDRGATD
ncbi:MAG TPA: DinB family protein [Vicinamibacterales bacterium]|nr:DinB family protein [Vicinamibacterales bacterium]